ncbi:EAL domain-containing protein [Bacterioplanoides sp.]|uniref:bifunctional diguanylate cyclase/phosphodiesterase n=1 Tax=Bacterioplanoides sp. TaxID=2066072 RepID=UPI003AFFDC97
MTLKQQFSWLTGLLVMVLWLGNLWVTVMNGRDYFQQQLNSRAYDAATSLALAMSQVEGNDDVQLSRLIDALFDRGFFESIELIRVGGDPLHRRARQALQQQTPLWFRQWVDLELIVAEADVTSGWQRLGTITVTSHSDFAYRDLWAMVRAELIWFAWVLVISLVALQLLLHWLFRPLRKVEQQALAICERDWQEQEDIPKPRELQRMVLAMNKMVRKLRTIFDEQSAMAEQLREASFQDEVTGLLNRYGFDQRLSHRLESGEEHSGVLLLLQLHGFAEFNQQHGRREGDERLQQLAETLNQWHTRQPSVLIGRRSGADFSMYLPCSDDNQAQQYVQQLFSELAAGLLSARQTVSDKALTFHIGAVYSQGQKEPIQPILIKADAALRQAQRQPQSFYQLYNHSDNAAVQSISQEWGASEWHTLLQQVLDEQSIQLQYLPVVSIKDSAVTQLEVFSRIHWQGESLSAARFWPMVEQHRMAAPFDLCIVEKVLIALRQNSAELSERRLCLNISPASLMDETFVPSLSELLQHYQDVAGCLCLEFPEFAIMAIEPALLALFATTKHYGVTLGVDKLGAGNLAFAYLQRLPLEYVRIDGSFNRGLHQAQDQRFFIQSMVQIAHNLDLLVLSEGLEDQDDIDVLRQMGVDGLSGFYFSRPINDLSQALNWQPL